ncbi:MAG: hypothetical protein U5K79_03185 [Cyclobacteriaceae bacterium]|nr:hypothetical protein [Cyclobacteriaceae bacterium]
MYRKEIKVIDCTLRDGGLMNNWQFSEEFVKAVYKALVEAGVDYHGNWLSEQRDGFFKKR